MNRETNIQAMRSRPGPFDILVIGGGSIGLGVALDASLRGYDVALVERGDFASGTSSKSTKLIHGGLRYLKQGNISLVKESLRERERLLTNAPSLVSPLGFVIPSANAWTRAYYRLGLAAYDLLAGSKTLANSSGLSASGVERLLPYAKAEFFKGGNLYFDARFDDARLCLTLATGASRHGAVLANYAAATGLVKDGDGRVRGAAVRDEETGETFDIRATVVLNACGPWSDAVRRLDESGADAMIVPSQGAHLVFDRAALPGEHAMMIPKTDDGRILFAIPFGQSVIVGTTDTALDRVPDEPVAMSSEVEFILRTLNRHVRDPLERSDIRSVFAGIRPLVRSGPATRTSKIARNHVVRVSPGSSLVTVTGGKWTTYRQIAQDAVDACERVGGFEPSRCETSTHSLEPYVPPVFDRPSGERVHDAVDLSDADIARMVEHEMCRTVEDVLARRRRLLIEDAAASLGCAERVARVLASALGRDAAWIAGEIDRFSRVARACLPPA
ncbi:MAG: glycerol-3-phosphate dehydrogenase/oxidase [Phycisphaerales bacterium]